MILGRMGRGDQSLTVSEKKKITACNNADSPVQGAAPEAEIFLHVEDV